MHVAARVVEQRARFLYERVGGGQRAETRNDQERAPRQAQPRRLVGGGRRVGDRREQRREGFVAIAARAQDVRRAAYDLGAGRAAAR